MDVEASEARQVEQRGAEELAEGSYDDQVGRPRANGIQGFGRGEAGRLDDGKAEPVSGMTNGRRTQAPASTGRTVGLGDDTYNMVVGRQGLKGWDGEVGAAQKDDAHVRYPSTPGGCETSGG
jgi:hypothetical protein